MRNPVLILVYLLSFSPFSLATSGDESNLKTSYTTTVLSNPIFDAEKVALETSILNSWLSVNYSKLTYEQMKGPREHLYYLIDSRIKEQFASTGNVLPKQHDLILETLFSWSERLGVYGGSQVYNTLKSPSASILPTFMRIPGSFALELDKDLFHIRSSTGGWNVAVPYYFMIWSLNDYKATNGLQTQLVAVSTGSAKHKNVVDYSQATLMLISSPPPDKTQFRAYWMKQLGITEKDQKADLGFRNLSSYTTFDNKTNLHQEVTFFESQAATFAVVYTGIDGTYQWNRPHFIDFLRAIYLSPNNALKSDIGDAPSPSSP